MMEVNVQPPTISDKDPLVLFPDPIVTGSLTSGRVQVQVQHMPSMLNADHYMAKWSSPSKT